MHARRYPLWQVQDIYKLAHQAALGSEHAVFTPDLAWQRLEEEVNSLAVGVAELLLDPISADGEIVRVHLHPSIDAGFSITELLDAFLRTSIDFKGSVDVLRMYLTQAEELTAKVDIYIRAAEFKVFIDGMHETGLPAVHHSVVYREHYSPAYRVVVRGFLSESLKTLYKLSAP